MPPSDTVVALIEPEAQSLSFDSGYAQPPARAGRISFRRFRITIAALAKARGRCSR